MIASTLIINCPVCGSDVADTLGVTGKMDGSLEAAVIMSCGDCQTVYLQPPPRGSDDAGVEAAATAVYEPAISDLKRELAMNQSLIIADASESEMLSRSDANGRFDRIVLPLTLESSEDPVALLKHVKNLLTDRGQLQVLTGNAGSSCFRWFCGRHWCGYRYPTARQYLTVESLQRAAALSGLGVMSHRTASSASAWLLSLRYLLQDWGTNRVFIAVLTGRWLVPWLFASALEAIAGMRGRAGVLVAKLEKAEGGEQ